MITPFPPRPMSVQADLRVRTDCSESEEAATCKGALAGEERVTSLATAPQAQPPRQPLAVPRPPREATPTPQGQGPGPQELAAGG